MTICTKSSSKIVQLLEKGFYHWGYYTARHPWVVILTSFIITCICSIGFLNLRFETDANEIWGPDTSLYIANNKWLSDHFPQDKRIQTIIFQSKSGGNILSPESLKYMIKTHKQISTLRPNNNSFQDICHR